MLCKNGCRALGLNKDKKQKVLKEEGYCCHYCSDMADTVDHKIPQAAGGTDARSNLVACCSRCNTVKGTLTYDVFVRFLRIYGFPDSLGWYTKTNAYVDRAVLNIMKQVDMKKTSEIVLEKFAAGDAEDALRLLRRGLYRSGVKPDEELLADLFVCEPWPVIGAVVGMR